MAALKAGVSLAALLLPATLYAAKPVPAHAPVAATPSAPSVKAGVERWRANDYAGAVAVWQGFAANGDADALFNMGQAYKLGRGVAADAATARDYYRRAAIKGHLPAQANLGIALFQVGQKAEAVKWLRTAADRGEARAQYVLGIAAFNGDGLPRSQATGYAYLTRAQASGLPQATAALGSIAPALSPTDRTAGDAIAASIAAGSGVPQALAGVEPRLNIPAGGVPRPVPVAMAATKPAVVPVASAPLPTVIARASAAPVPSPAPASPGFAAATPVTTAPSPAPLRAAPPPPVQERVVEPGARPATSPPVAVATTDIPASRPAPITAPAPAAVVPRPAPVKPVQTAALKPFETIIPAKPVAKPAGWRVQLGAFSARRQADTAWAAAKADAGAAKPIFNDDGPVVKLQIGPFATRDKAKAACAKLSDAGRSCFVTEG